VSVRVSLWVIFLSVLVGCGDGTPKNEVVLFCAQDRLFAEPLLADFEKQTGIKVRAQFDDEAAKTVGLTTRLIARKGHPECDVFWNNEIAQTCVLRDQGILETWSPAAGTDLPGGFKDSGRVWTGFAVRARVILYNTELVKPEDAPQTLQDLVQPRFKNKVAMARPLFGTTLTHAAALFEAWGPDKAQAWFRALNANGVKIAAGNAMARNLVVSGECAVCLTDTDDANGAFLKQAPVAMIYPDQDGLGTLVIPHTVMLIKNGPHPEQAKKLIEYLLSAAVEARLAKGESAQMPLRPGVPGPGERFVLSKIKAMPADWDKISQHFEAVKKFVESEFVK